MRADVDGAEVGTFVDFGEPRQLVEWNWRSTAAGARNRLLPVKWISLQEAGAGFGLLHSGLRAGDIFAMWVRAFKPRASGNGRYS
jgi:hypothetical protein